MTQTSLPAELSAALFALLSEIQDQPNAFMLEPLAGWGRWLEDRGYSSSGLADFLLANLKNQKESNIDPTLIVNVFADCCQRSCSTGEFIDALESLNAGFVKDYIDALVPSLRFYSDTLKIAGGSNHTALHKAHTALHKPLHKTLIFEANHPGIDVAELVAAAAVITTAICWSKKKENEVGQQIIATEERNIGSASQDIAKGAENRVNVLISKDQRVVDNFENHPLQYAEEIDTYDAKDLRERLVLDIERELNTLKGDLEGLVEESLENQAIDLSKYLESKGYFKKDLYPEVLDEEKNLEDYTSFITQRVKLILEKVDNADPLNDLVDRKQLNRWISISTDVKTGAEKPIINMKVLDEIIPSENESLHEQLSDLGDPKLLRPAFDPRFVNFEKNLAIQTENIETLLQSRAWEKFLADGKLDELGHVRQLLLKDEVKILKDEGKELEIKTEEYVEVQVDEFEGQLDQKVIKEENVAQNALKKDIANADALIEFEF